MLFDIFMIDDAASKDISGGERLPFPQKLIFITPLGSANFFDMIRHEGLNLK